MKKIYFILILIVSCSLSVPAQNNTSIRVTDIQLIHADGSVTMTFNFHAGRKATGKDYNLVVNPVLRRAGSSLQLPSIVVQGSRAKVSEERHKLATGEPAFSQRPFYTQNGRTLNYGTVFPFEDWMAGSQLAFEGISVGCCSATEVEVGLIVDNVLYSAPKQKVEVVEVPVQVAKVVEVVKPEVVKPEVEVPVVAPVVLSVGDQLAQKYPFVEPVSKFEQALQTPSGLFDYNMPLNMGREFRTPGGRRQGALDYFINETREGSLSVYFPQGSSLLDRYFAGNNRALVELVSTVRSLAGSGDSRIVRIVIAGFASPEGTLQFNDRLAWERAVALKEMIQTNTGVASNLIQLYNGSVDWAGLRALVAQSDMYEKYRVMDIIDTMPVWDGRRNVGRHGTLMRLNNGETYRYMLRTLFPSLRQAAFIKVYYDNK